VKRKKRYCWADAFPERQISKTKRDKIRAFFMSLYYGMQKNKSLKAPANQMDEIQDGWIAG
jgi:hypothetical protein